MKRMVELSTPCTLRSNHCITLQIGVPPYICSWLHVGCIFSCIGASLALPIPSKPYISASPTALAMLRASCHAAPSLTSISVAGMPSAPAMSRGLLSHRAQEQPIEPLQSTMINTGPLVLGLVWKTLVSPRCRRPVFLASNLPCLATTGMAIGSV